MSINTTEHDVGDLTIQQVSRRSGLSESTLRYYEGIGLIDKVPRDPRNGTRSVPKRAARRRRSPKAAVCLMGRRGFVKPPDVAVL